MPLPEQRAQSASTADLKKNTDCDVSQLSVDWQLVRERIVKVAGDNFNSAIPCCNFTARQPFPVKLSDVGRYFTL
jgi:hypothetical protein